MVHPHVPTRGSPRGRKRAAAALQAEAAQVVSNTSDVQSALNAFFGPFGCAPGGAPGGVPRGVAGGVAVAAGAPSAAPAAAASYAGASSAWHPQQKGHTGVPAYGPSARIRVASGGRGGKGTNFKSFKRSTGTKGISGVNALSASLAKNRFSNTAVQRIFQFFP